MYRALLAFHLVAVISWMAGILYLIRLLVYHAAETEAVVKSRFVVMEQRLYRVITVPAMMAAVGFGAWMIALNPSLLSEGWMHAKLGLVVLLVGITHYAKRAMRQLGAGQCEKSERFFRILNEVPTLLMIGIVFLVILRPF